MNNTITYPDWCEKPFNLTPEEISDPSQVLSNFCWQYSPAEVRLKLKDWYAASLADEAADNRAIFTIYESVEKLIEAVYLINV
jgi:outer membrane biogenesis lipoprotein LolB